MRVYSESSEEPGEGPSSYCSISRENYPRGFTLYLVKFNAASTERFLPAQARANLKVTVQFREPPEENLSMILLAKFASLLEVDINRRVSI